MKLKRIIAVSFIGLLFLVGCTDTTNTPSKKVEDFLAKYQKMDNDVLTQLEVTMDSDTEMDADQKKEYKALMEKQYQNMSYKITDEKVEDDTATVDAEIEVYDYATSITKSKEYYTSHKDEFAEDKATITTPDDDTNKNAKTNDDTATNNETTTDDNTTTDNNTTDDVTGNKKFIDYKIKQLKDVTDKTTYTITFNLTKTDGEWTMDDITDADRQKLHGLY